MTSASKAATPDTGPPPLLTDGDGLFLDFDGTLVSIAARPDEVIVPDGFADRIAELALALHHRLAIVSGRPVEALRDEFGLAEIVLAGSHGTEIAFPGQPVTAPDRPATLGQALEDMRRFGALNPGIVVEDKPFGIGLHYRGAPELAETCNALAEGYAGRDGLVVQSGKMVIELRLGSANKGAAILELMKHAPFKDSLPIFLGDDSTDEDGFSAVRQCGGHGVLVGDPRETQAHYRLPDVASVFGWLERSIDTLTNAKRLASDG